MITFCSGLNLGYRPPTHDPFRSLVTGTRRSWRCRLLTRPAARVGGSPTTGLGGFVDQKRSFPVSRSTTWIAPRACLRQRTSDQIGGVFGAELPDDSPAMIGDALLADTEACGNLPVCGAVGDLGEHVAFHGGEVHAGIKIGCREIRPGVCGASAP